MLRILCVFDIDCCNDISDRSGHQGDKEDSGRVFQRKEKEKTPFVNAALIFKSVESCMCKVADITCLCSSDFDGNAI